MVNDMIHLIIKAPCITRHQSPGSKHNHLETRHVMEQRSRTIPNVGDTTIAMRNVEDGLQSAIRSHFTQWINSPLVQEKCHRRNTEANSPL